MEENKELQEYVIDLGAASNGEVNESYLRMFGGAIKGIMNHMFGGGSVPVTVKGNQTQVRDFARVLGREKRYLDSYRKFGLDNPQTYRSRYALDSAVKKFERSTNLKWPFK
tara:strand:+ start:2554 stop:2886 length:333 start_codon:yes stop_codon:yes gene_type:complete